MAASIKLKLNFLPLSFNSFATLTQNFKSIPHVNPKLLNFNQEHPVKSLQNWDYDNLSHKNARVNKGHMITSTI